MEINEIIQQRLDKLKNLQQKGLNPYVQRFAPDKTIASVLADFKETEKVILAGRIMANRSHGKVSFLDLQDSSSKIQLYLKAQDLSENSQETFKSLDIGDVVGIKGELFITHTKEPTVKVNEIIILSKTLRPLPEKIGMA
jgi:Lysyl-tRNA synthetase (class II)